ncbi:MAG: VWA domain-containing protein [Alphaproteobacteria bacterium]|nr:VWA domain-containing protein [Alphaproteobacteria bacterium]
MRPPPPGAAARGPTAPLAGPVPRALLDQLPTGWEAAQQLHRLRRTLRQGPILHAVTERAIDAVIQRARSLLRHAARPTREVRDRWPAPGILDAEATLAEPPRPRLDPRRAPWDPQNLHVVRREPRDADVVAILDMSLSMTGEKIALTAVSAAILHLKLEQVAVVAFDTNAHTLVRVGERPSLRALVRRVLTVPAQGYTHISAGLEEGLNQLHRSSRRERVGLLMSDGIANVGVDPVTVARRFPALHVIQVGRDLPQGTRACTGMALAGRGRRFHAPTYVALPGVVKRVVREVFR